MTAYAFLRRKGLIRSKPAAGRIRRLLSPEQVQAAWEKVQSGERAKAVARGLNVSHMTLLHRFRELGLRPRRGKAPMVPLNSGAFTTVTEESAYWAGFLLADGHCGLDGRTVALSLAERDIGHVQTFRSFLGAANRITIYRSREHLLQGRTVKSGNQAGLSIRNRRVWSDLQRFGVVPRKTFCALVPTFLADNRHFWRGMVDGDGTVRINRPGTRSPYPCPDLYLVGTEAVVRGFATFCRAAIRGAEGNIGRPRPTLWRFSISGTKAALIVRLLYMDSRVALPRKARTAMEIGEMVPRQARRRRSAT